MQSRCRLWLVLGASAALVLGCRSGTITTSRSSPDPAPAGSGSKPVPDENLVEAHAHYATGIIHELNNDPELALQEYYLASLNDPANEALAVETSRRLLQSNQPEKALDILSRAAAQPGASGLLSAQLGYVYARLGKTDLALKADRAAVQKSPKSLTGYHNLYLAYVQDQKFPQALQVLDDAAQVRGTDAEFLIGLAELYANYGVQVPAGKEAAGQRALALLHRAQTFNLNDPQIRLKLADGFELLGEDGEALKIYSHLLAQIPDTAYWHDSIRAKLAEIYLRNHDRGKAVEQLEAVIRDDPTSVQAYYLLGNISYEEKKYTEAADYFGKVLLLKPDFEPVYVDLAGAQVMADKPELALKTIGTAQQLFPQRFQFEYLAGMACSRLKEFTNAISHFTTAEVIGKASSTNALNEGFYFQFGAACERNGDYAQAADYFQRCIDIDPNFSEALNYLGYMWAERGEHLDRARELIRRALKIEPENAAYLDSMGWVLFQLHQPKEALDYILKAIRLSEEEDATVYEHLGDVYQALNQTEKAREAWSKALRLEPSDALRAKLGGTPTP
jgi:tetratricopeptide (TPR) repeat protein